MTLARLGSVLAIGACVFAQSGRAEAQVAPRDGDDVPAFAQQPVPGAPAAPLVVTTHRRSTGLMVLGIVSMGISVPLIASGVIVATGNSDDGFSSGPPPAAFALLIPGVTLLVTGITFTAVGAS